MITGRLFALGFTTLIVIVMYKSSLKKRMRQHYHKKDEKFFKWNPLGGEKW